MKHKTKDEIIKILNEVKDEVKSKYKAEIKGIFGSYARGDENKTSDIDIIVDFEKGADLFDLVETSMFLEEKLSCPVDIIPRDSIRSEIKELILQETIYI
jgi:predicted nucleotidyltransferase